MVRLTANANNLGPIDVLHLGLRHLERGCTLRQSLRARSLVIISCLAISACSTVGGQQGSPEDLVRQRAQGRWSALIAGDWDKAYVLMAPSYRAVINLNRFRGQFGSGALWQKAEIGTISCETDNCTVQVKVTFRPAMARASSVPALETGFDETWVREDGQWWKFDKL